MLNVLRKLNEDTLQNKKVIIEQETPNPQMGSTKEVNDDFIVINDVEVKLLSTDQMDMKLSEEQKNLISNIIDSFRQQVSELTEFDPGMVVNTDQIRLDGSISELDINFVLIAGQDFGTYINADMLKLTPEVIIMITKLDKFYQNFVDAMNNIITQRKNN